jgi:cell division protein ZapA
MTKRTVRVHIVGEEYPIRTERSPEVTRAVADYVDRTIRGILEGGSVIETQKAAILAAMKITDELFHAREQGAELAESIGTPVSATSQGTQHPVASRGRAVAPSVLCS